MNYGSEAERSSTGSAGVAPVAWKPRCQPRGSPAKTSRQAVDKIYRYPLAIACVRLGAVTQPSNLFQRKINGLSMTESSKWAWCWQSRVCSLTMPYHLSIAPRLGGWGWGVVTGLTMPCQSINSTQPGGKGGGVVTGLTMPCQSINSTQPGGKGGSHRSDNALSSINSTQPGGGWGVG